MLNGESGRPHPLESKLRNELQLPVALQGVCHSASIVYDIKTKVELVNTEGSVHSSWHERTKKKIV